MRKIILLLCLLAMAVGMTVHGAPQQKNDVPQDSRVEVIGWFNKNDTAIYWIHENSWRIYGADTVHEASASIKMRITVVDSTARGYKMNCTFLEFPMKEMPESVSPREKMLGMITDKVGQTIVGTTIKFETDECGQITKFTNLGEIKKQVKTMFKEVLNVCSQIPEIEAAQKAGFDMKDAVKKINTDKLVDGYLQELKLMFAYHGCAMKTGEFTEHNDATDEQYENTTYSSASFDEDEETYCIVTESYSLLPPDELKALFGEIVDKKIAKSLEKAAEENGNVGQYDNYLEIKYLGNGWPYYVASQITVKIGDGSKVKQRIISLDSFSF